MRTIDYGEFVYGDGNTALIGVVTNADGTAFDFDAIGASAFQAILTATGLETIEATATRASNELSIAAVGLLKDPGARKAINFTGRWKWTAGGQSQYAREPFTFSIVVFP